MPPKWLLASKEGQGLTKWLSKSNLLMALGALLIIKFAVQPILIWQDDTVDKLDAKHRKLSKLTLVMDHHSSYQIQLDQLDERLLGAVDLFYLDDANVKLTIQKEIEKIFESNQINIDGFNWIFDRGSPIRHLRASVRYSGGFHKMVKTFWDLALLPKAVRQVGWNQRAPVSADLSATLVTGELTLEFYARALSSESSDLETIGYELALVNQLVGLGAGND